MAMHWIAPAWGSPDLWQFVEQDVPAPAEGEVVIRVHAAGMNPADYKHVAAPRSGTTLPVAIGYEVSGEIAAIGPGTRIASGDARVGDRVVAFRVQGGYATELLVPADKVLAGPSALRHEEAANLLLAGTTASEMLHVVGAAEGETVVLHGASGAVGVAVLQLAAERGVRVVGTASPASFERVRGFGGIPVEYGPGLADRVRAAAPEGVAAALDAVGTDEAVDTSLELVADRDRIVTIAAPQRAAEAGFRAIAGAQPASAAYRDGVRAELIALADAGRLQVPLARTYPLAEAREAVRFLAEGHPGGKIALVP
ncbi:NADP-dependent oxidoreductase [Microbacterium terricola]|uniref:Oxidoreductase n=1 Tax=Microbacterium terricola TaxID=344163 RepID=A0ABM8DYH4_9MICO|nr:NADP-dependent oxidoreductase [Microbacterium terricola]UYK41502.1 NADP-dependent oxidoreductase [Microbacterium terricola]BDV30707.1 putative oxidoreductase [Microbacterium terricola]